MEQGHVPVGATDEQLAAIRDSATPRLTVEALRNAGWDSHGRGHITVATPREGERGPCAIQLITHDSPENDEMLGILRHTSFWRRYWHSSTKNGRHVFAVPENLMDAPFFDGIVIQSQHYSWLPVIDGTVQPDIAPEVSESLDEIAGYALMDMEAGLIDGFRIVHRRGTGPWVELGTGVVVSAG